MSNSDLQQYVPFSWHFVVVSGRNVYGISMGVKKRMSDCGSYDISQGFVFGILWDFYFQMVWKIYVMSMVFLLDVYGISMGFLWDPYGISLGHLKDFFANSMGFL
jgi:hypothetical protein